MKILALDLSLSSTGWARWDGSTVSSGVLEGPGTGMERVEAIRARVESLAYGVDVAAVEGYSYASRGRSIVSLGELGGVIRHWFFTVGLPVLEVPPACRCKYACGKGNASKDAVLVAAVRRLGYQGHSHDEGDALWLLATALDLAGIPLVTVPASHRAALARLTWPMQLQQELVA